MSAERVLTRAVESPLVRGGLTLVAGVLTGNILGFVRVALTAYLLGTHSRADSLAVAMGPLDTLNSVLINSMVFAFVPMLTAASGPQRTALFLKLSRCFAWVFSAIAAAVVLTAPWLMKALAPGLDPHYFGTAVTILRILSLSTVAAGVAAVHCALLYTDRRFAPTAFYQAALNVFTIVAALSLWKLMGVYAFAIGYTLGACAQVGIVCFAARSGLDTAGAPRCQVHWREILAKPAFFVVYAAGLGLNITFTRAYATHAGPGMAAALEYCMRGVGVPLAILVNPISNSLLPEIARLRSLFRLREAFRLIDRTIALAALVAVAGCAFAIAFRQPAIALIFQRGSFTAESTTAGVRGLSGPGAEPGRLEPDRDHLAFPVRARPSLAAGDRGPDSAAVQRGPDAGDPLPPAAMDRVGSLPGTAGRFCDAVGGDASQPAEMAGAGVRGSARAACPMGVRISLTATISRNR